MIVSNIDAEITEDQLMQELTAFGEVINIEVQDGPIKSALVTYYSAGEAQKAVLYLNGKVLVKNTLFVGLKKTAQRRRSKNSFSHGLYMTQNLV